MADKLFVDDRRKAPTGWLHARTARAAIASLKRGEIEALSLDHDLGSNRATGYTVALWLEQEAALDHWAVVPAVIVTHSANPVGRRAIEAAVMTITRYGTEIL